MVVVFFQGPSISNPMTKKRSIDGTSLETDVNSTNLEDADSVHQFLSSTSSSSTAMPAAKRSRTEKTIQTGTSPSYTISVTDNRWANNTGRNSSEVADTALFNQQSPLLIEENKICDVIIKLEPRNDDDYTLKKVEFCVEKLQDEIMKSDS